MDPELIIIGGGLAASGAALIDPLTHSVKSGLVWRSAPRIVTGSFAGEAGRRGAGLLAWRALQHST
jgi:glucokinase